MNLNNIREGELKEVFDALEEAFVSKHVNFYLIGALAKDVWYSMSDKVMRTTRDVDFALMISNKADYEEVRTYLADIKGFQYQKSNEFILVSSSVVEIDILPLVQWNQ
jgi:predicted nucleotidyltransferase